MGYKCPLGRFTPTEFEKETVKRRGWQEDKILVIHANDPRIDWAEAEIIRVIGNRLYGKGEHEN